MNPDLPRGEFSGKPINKVSPFCPRATAEGMVGPGSAARFLTWKQGRKFLWIYGASCARTSAVFISRRSLKPKGRDGREEVSPQDKQDFGIWALSKRQGGSMYTSWSTPMKRVYGFRKKINLLFCNMNTYGGRKPR